jgi:hypothetical protein
MIVSVSDCACSLGSRATPRVFAVQQSTSGVAAAPVCCFPAHHTDVVCVIFWHHCAILKEQCCFVRGGVGLPGYRAVPADRCTAAAHVSAV